MIARGNLWAGLLLMRPAQWPVLTAQLLIGMLLTAPAAGATRQQWWSALPWLPLGMAWLSWVVLLNGGTLAFNSAYDRDTGPVAYLARPPVPPVGLAPAALFLMVLGIAVSWPLVGRFFGLVVACATVLSVLYSHPATRWKSRPGLDLLVNIVGYGLGTTVAGLSAVTGRAPAGSGWWFAVGFGLLFGSFYPLTQIYQTTADSTRGDRTLSTALGVQNSLRLALGLGLAGGGALLLGCRGEMGSGLLAVVGLVVGLWNGHLVWWLQRHTVWTNARRERGMYLALGLWSVVDLALAAAWLLR